MKASLILSAALAFTTTGCVYATQPTETVDEDGRTWVRLSTDESLLPDMHRRALDAGCVEFNSEIYDIDGLQLVCDKETVQVTQNLNWLGFQCSSLAATTCSKLVLSLTTDRKAAQFNALGGAGWGI